VVNEKLVEIAKGMDVVVEGRDMTTVVFPHADVKIFLDADIDTRARRRCGQFQAESTLEEVRKQIRQRDEYDRTKRHGSLRISPDALYLDTSDLTLDQVCDKVINTVRKMRNHQELQGSHGR
jgi:cytidylate kinase